ncbi:MAG: exodeoxyribonuclease VII large subunit [Planctomycetota bacterium]|nr:MAG: exodeoxyribonuclease VII large subunit [Planctomycetota bacterium]
MAKGGDRGPVFSISQALHRVRDLLEYDLGSLWLKGEVFEYRGPYRGSGHYYFKLRDRDAVMEVKMWAATARRGLRCELQEGREVLARGHFDVWPKRGQLSFLLQEVEDLGAGDLARRFEILKARLQAEGLFDAERKRLLPLRPQRVALITAFPSAAAADVLQSWQEARAPFQVWVRPARVQGAEAVADLCMALAEAESIRPDLILLCRGGGSLEDLWAFQEEAVVRAIADCQVPILCGVGHETDFSLADFAADERAKTPTAAAHRTVEGWRQARRQVDSLAEALQAAVLATLQVPHRRLDRLARNLRGQAPDRRLERRRRDLLQWELRLSQIVDQGMLQSGRRLSAAAQAFQMQHPGPKCRLTRTRLQGLAKRLPLSCEHALAASQNRLQSLAARLQSASPSTWMERGFALVERPGKDGYLRQADQVQAGEAIHVRLASGSLDATVETVYPEPKKDDPS